MAGVQEAIRACRLWVGLWERWGLLGDTVSGQWVPCGDIDGHKRAGVLAATAELATVMATELTPATLCPLPFVVIIRQWTANMMRWAPAQTEALSINVKMALRVFTAAQAKLDTWCMSFVFTSVMGCLLRSLFRCTSCRPQARARQSESCLWCR